MQELMIITSILLALTLIILVSVQPRESQRFFRDLTDQIGKPGYWQSQRGLKATTLLVSLSLLGLLLILMLLQY
ncbi:accessory Sec system protein Asp5 [Streptococcus oricebi]|uniref:Accessory secretory protein Asp5 n=1 Tax=Streptococcus oricebi TaxID=1547447 RepID=A0ABS5B2B8_9STRE|nr:accessory secretory protein Asp5 [Streptococcus oricebi]MBP2622974.1 accessory secretory protein Asp5 [Streptococcus oricebi]